ncbi:MAG: LemA family protein [Syntrophaceae bacterium]|nr:LemA family protein [Syntrophaceae bacterium]
MRTSIAIAVVLIVLVLLFNSLVNKKNKTLNAFAGIDVLLKKRYDLIPNLVSAVKQYMKHEREVLTRITELRTRALKGELSDDEKVTLDKQMSGAIKGLMVAVEKYPELKANENFLQLQAALNEVEEQISAARRAYNATVLEYNNALEMIPSNVMAAMMRYKKKRFFEIVEAEKAPVPVQTIFES